jgi:septum formation protein
MTKTATSIPIVIGSRSPRRLELLQLIADPARLVVLPPRDADEPGFDGLVEMSEFEARCHEIVDLKRQDVIRQLNEGDLAQGCVVICADTTVVVEDAAGGLLALGQPQETGDWQKEVRCWFRDYLAGRTHFVLSAVSVSLCDEAGSVSRTLNQSCMTSVRMRDDVDDWLDWYISTGEPLGKAGGYAVQGAGSVFVTKFEGSYSNVVGLPIENTIEMLREIGALSS